MMWDMETRLKEIIAFIAGKNGWEILALETMPEHVHLFIQISPRIFPNNTIVIINGTISILIRREFPELRRILQTLWTPSYFV